MRYKYTEDIFMKKLLLTLSLVVCSTAFANPYHHGHHGHGHWRHYPGSGWNWVVPAIIGGAIVYEVTKPPVVVQQPPVVVQQPTQQTQNCSPWTEIQNSDGSITRTRTCQ
jgi:hypothetical protein